MTTDSTLEPFARLVGTWTTEATHPAMPGVVVHGTLVVEWLEGGRFLVQRARNDHPDFPDSLVVIGRMGRDRADTAAAQTAPVDGDPSPLRMHYFDSRGVFRDYETRMDDGAWRVWRDAPGFAQRFTGTLSDDGDTIDGRSELCRDDVHWADDLRTTYRRQR
jgi:hypothetical protein